MNEPKFTKGPWKVKDKTYGRYTIISIYSEKSKMRLLVKMPLQYEFSHDDWIKNYNLDEVRANAALIACSPEMYLMLEKCRTALRNCGMSCLSEDVFLLLKKARGEQ